MLCARCLQSLRPCRRLGCLFPRYTWCIFTTPSICRPRQAYNWASCSSVHLVFLPVALPCCMACSPCVKLFTPDTQNGAANFAARPPATLDSVCGSLLWSACRAALPGSAARAGAARHGWHHPRRSKQRSRTLPTSTSCRNSGASTRGMAGTAAVVLVKGQALKVRSLCNGSANHAHNTSCSLHTSGKLF